MSKQWPDWSNFNKELAKEPEHLESAPLKKTGKGGDIIGEQFQDMAKTIGQLPPTFRQPTQAEQEAFLQRLIPGLAKSPEELAKADKDWGDKINNWYKDATKPIESNQAPTIGRGPIKLEKLTEEEERLRNIIANDDDGESGY